MFLDLGLCKRAERYDQLPGRTGILHGLFHQGLPGALAAQGVRNAGMVDDDAARAGLE